jgi:hypothetical protein
MLSGSQTIRSPLLRLLLLLLACLTAGSLFAGCSPASSGGIQCAETYLDHLIKGEYAEAYNLLSDYDKQNISQDTYLRWRQAVAQIITIEEASVSSGVDKFPNYKYQGTTFGYVLGLKISRQQKVLKTGIELDGYNQPDYRQMVVFENDQWRMLLLITNLDETVAAYEALLQKTP